MPEAPRAPPPAEAFGRLSAGIHVGLDFFERRRLSLTDAEVPRGLVESLD